MSKLSARKSTAFDNGGRTVFAKLVATFPRFFKILLTVLIADFRPPLWKDFVKVSMAALTGF